MCLYSDPWNDGMVLKNSFSRIFYLAINKMADG